MTGQAARTGDLKLGERATRTAVAGIERRTQSRLGWSAFFLSLILLLSASFSAFSAGKLSIQIDPSNQGDIYVYDVTAGALFYSANTVTPFSLPIPTFDDGFHTFKVWVEKEGHRLILNNWPADSAYPADWTPSATGDEVWGQVDNGAEALHFDTSHIDLIVEKQCHDLIAGDQDVAAYTIIVTHELGWEAATGATLEDQLPSGLSNARYTVDDGSPGGSWPTSSPYQITLGTIDAGGSTTIVIYADVALDLTSIDTNTATVKHIDDVYTDNSSSSCTNILKPRGRIIIRKETDPAGNTSVFSFIGDLGAFDLAGDGASQSFIVVPGIYTVTESASAGWILTSISITDPDGGTSSADNTATIDLDAGEIITVAFSNYFEPKAHYVR